MINIVFNCNFINMLLFFIMSFKKFHSKLFNNDLEQSNHRLKTHTPKNGTGALNLDSDFISMKKPTTTKLRTTSDIHVFHYLFRLPKQMMMLISLSIKD